MKAEEMYDKYAEKYDSMFLTNLDMAENNQIFKKIEQEIYGGRVLDVGCGTGLLLSYIPIPPDLYAGVDISSGMLDIAKKTFPEHRFYQEDMAKMMFKSNSFDYVVIPFGSFSYCLEPFKALEEFHRVLKPDGKLILMTMGVKYPTHKYDFTNRANGTSPEKKAILSPSIKVPLITYTNRWISEMVGEMFHVIESYGFSGPVSNRWKHISIQIMEKVLLLENNTFGRWSPDKCFFQVIVGAKNEHFQTQ